MINADKLRFSTLLHFSGEVFLVRHVESKELFALKRIRKDRVIERNEVKRAFMERDILSFMHNPFVVSMLCSFQTKTHLCMVLEYVEGGDVGTLLTKLGSLETELARLVLHSCCVTGHIDHVTRDSLQCTPSVQLN